MRIKVYKSYIEYEKVKSISSFIGSFALTLSLMLSGCSDSKNIYDVSNTSVDIFKADDSTDHQIDERLLFAQNDIDMMNNFPVVEQEERTYYFDSPQLIGPLTVDKITWSPSETILFVSSSSDVPIIHNEAVCNDDNGFFSTVFKIGIAMNGGGVRCFNSNQRREYTALI